MGFAFNQYRSCQIIEFIQVSDAIPVKSFHKGHPLGNGNGHLSFPEGIEEISEHVYLSPGIIIAGPGHAGFHKVIVIRLFLQ